MIRIVFLFCALFALPTAQAGDDAANWLESDGYAEIARWMLEQPDAQMRAAGLLALAGEQAGNRSIEPDTFLESTQQLLDESAPASALFLLAHGCKQLDMTSACIEAGLDDAIVRRDGGNPLSRGTLYGPESEGFRDVLLSAKGVRDHTAAFALAWHEALISNETDPDGQGDPLVAALSLAFSIPSSGYYSHLLDACGNAVGKDEALDEACRRLAAMLQQGNMNLLMQSLGYAMARSRAEALGENELAVKYEEERQDVMNEAAGLARNAHEVLVEPSDQRGFLQRWRDEGELAAFRALDDPKAGD
jgi:hypothetical protein